MSRETKQAWRSTRWNKTLESSCPKLTGTSSNPQKTAQIRQPTPTNTNPRKHQLEHSKINLTELTRTSSGQLQLTCPLGHTHVVGGPGTSWRQPKHATNRYTPPDRKCNTTTDTKADTKRSGR